MSFKFRLNPKNYYSNFYKFDKLPSYALIDTMINLKEMDKNGKYSVDSFNGYSFSIIDDDLLDNSIRVFIKDNEVIISSLPEELIFETRAFIVTFLSEYIKVIDHAALNDYYRVRNEYRSDYSRSDTYSISRIDLENQDVYYKIKSEVKDSDNYKNGLFLGSPKNKELVVGYGKYLGGFKDKVMEKYLKLARY